jgi:hypothetical protein
MDAQTYLTRLVHGVEASDACALASDILYVRERERERETQALLSRTLFTISFCFKQFSIEKVGETDDCNGRN